MEAPAFVVFRHDRTMPPGYWHPHMADRLAAPKIVELDGDHEAMLTAPDRRQRNRGRPPGTGARLARMRTGMEAVWGGMWKGIGWRRVGG